jgi:hypothetical protein
MSINDINDNAKMAELGRRVVIKKEINKRKESMRDCATLIQSASDLEKIEKLIYDFVNAGNELVEFIKMLD